jgi:hypothetical protein
MRHPALLVHGSALVAAALLLLEKRRISTAR